MSLQKTNRFCNGVVKRIGGGFGNPILIALAPLITQLIAGLVSKMKCFQPKPDVAPEPIPTQLQRMWDADRENVIRQLIPQCRRAAFEAGKRDCKASGKKYRRSDYAMSDADARALAFAHVHEALGTKPADASEIIGYVTTQLGNEPIVG